MMMSEKFKEISKDNSYKNDLLSEETFNKLIAAAENGEFLATVKITKEKDIEILEKEGFSVYKAYHKTDIYIVSWDN